ncbi:hypothetical protein G6F59_014954 [Rhizopus arrhizus]|nr:hypothetical protein G6F59_014954 [Rhizopus arrhizus]
MAARWPAGAAPRPSGRPPVIADRAAASGGLYAGRTAGALRTQGIRAGRDLGHQPVRPMGRGVRQGAGQEHHARTGLPATQPAGSFHPILDRRDRAPPLARHGWAPSGAQRVV